MSEREELQAAVDRELELLDLIDERPPDARLKTAIRVVAGRVGLSPRALKRRLSGAEGLGDFTLTIEVGNDGMSEPVHIAGALRDVASKVSRGDTSGRIMDVNGNSVGTFEFANA